jgi:penicillin-binding protein 1A
VDAYGENEVENGGLRVYTTVDPRAEAIALAAMRDSLDRRGDPAAALVSIDPRTGAVRALASSWHGHHLQFDLPTSAARQTGSAFKPFVLTAAVWLHHADPDHTWYDSSRFTYHGWTPRTYENRYFGPETLTKATLLSDNVVYAKLTLDVGPAAVAWVAHKLGIQAPLQVVPSIGLGSNSVTPLDLASAYATLASGGVHHDPYVISKVVLADGKAADISNWQPRDSYQAIPRGVAWTVTKVLEQNVQSGTGVAARIPGRHVAGKTGTTTRWTDAWFAGYTPRLTTVTWVGYPLSERRSMSDVHGIEVQGATFPAEIWHTYMVRALAHLRPLDFPRGKWPLVPYNGPRSMNRG